MTTKRRNRKANTTQDETKNDLGEKTEKKKKKRINFPKYSINKDMTKLIRGKNNIKPFTE